MKFCKTFFFMLALLLVSTAAQAIHSPLTKQQVSIDWLQNQDDQQIAVDEATTFASLKLKDFSEQAGRKLKLSEKAAFLYAKHQVKRQLKKNKKGKTIRRPGNNEGIGIGILLGFLLGLLGVLIAYLALKDKKPGVVKGAWIGFGLLFVLMIVYIVAIVNSVT